MIGSKINSRTYRHAVARTISKSPIAGKSWHLSFGRLHKQKRKEQCAETLTDHPKLMLAALSGSSSSKQRW